MADSSCSKTYQASCYITMAILLSLISYTTIKHENSLSSTHALALNASHALRSRGNFNVIATLIHISPELFLSGNQSTIFAILDSAISNLSITPLEMRQLLLYHTSTAFLPKEELFKKKTPFCFKTRFQEKNLVVNEVNSERNLVKINNLVVSQLDLFLGGSVVVHGVSAPFDMVSSVSCGGLNVSGGIEWSRVVMALSSKGFVSFAIGLNAVLDGIVREYPDLGSVTVFVPPNSGFISSPSPFFEKAVRVHVVRQRFSYMELVDAGEPALGTLVRGFDLKIEEFSEKLSINGVEIIAPDVYSSDKFVIHGVSRAFDVEKKLFSSPM